jgi:hypothetical protein
MPTPQEFAQLRINKHIINTRLMQPDNLQVRLFVLNHTRYILAPSPQAMRGLGVGFLYLIAAGRAVIK